MLLLLGSSQNGILSTTQYTVNIYWVCNLHNCIHLHLCTCTCIHLHTCVHLHILLRSCNFFSHLHRTFCSLHRILPLFRTCKIFLTQIFKCPNKKKECSHFVTFQPLSRIYFLVCTFCSDLATFQPLLYSMPIIDIICQF